SFSSVSPGQYRVQFVLPAGYLFTAQDQGSDDGIDSDPSTTTGLTDYVTVDWDIAPSQVDAGFVFNLGSLSGHTWIDTSADGIQDEGEDALPGVSVRLIDSDGAQVASTTTDSNGDYSFTNVAPGDYQVRFVVPSNYLYTLQDQGSDPALDSDADSSTGYTEAVTVAA